MSDLWKIEISKSATEDADRRHWVPVLETSIKGYADFVFESLEPSHNRALKISCQTDTEGTYLSGEKLGADYRAELLQRASGKNEREQETAGFRARTPDE